MRSNQVYRALAQGISRFEVCQLVSKGVRATHVLGSRFEDTINQTLECIGSDRQTNHPEPRNPEPIRPDLPQKRANL